MSELIIFEESTVTRAGVNAVADEPLSAQPSAATYVIAIHRFIIMAGASRQARCQR
ncbi:MAG TPA: hypothetical protein VMJ10_02350 [Kofleriaceae bacterium]|nr:hypothetical protein [Kofleriaceae bacterium]